MKSSQGMWIFLATEVLIFGVLIFLYQVSFFQQESIFRAEAGRLHFYHGTINTVVLLTSSYFVALADHSKNKKWLIGTILLGFLFLCIKGAEYYDLILEGRFPLYFKDLPPGALLFYSYYSFLTMLHGLHIIIGIGLLIGVFFIREFNFQENAGLYWHFVDMVWVFIFPLFYLAGST